MNDNKIFYINGYAVSMDESGMEVCITTLRTLPNYDVKSFGLFTEEEKLETTTEIVSQIVMPTNVAIQLCQSLAGQLDGIGAAFNDSEVSECNG